MATETPAVYQGIVPKIDLGGLSPLQLALAQLMLTGTGDPNTYPFGLNQLFRDEMTTFADSKFLSPIEFGYRCSFSDRPSLTPGIEGYSYIIENDEDIYLVRRAQDCGPDENRLEKVFIGKKTQLATGTFSYYGSIVRGGSAVNGAGGPWGTGGLTSPYPGPASSILNPYNNTTDLAVVPTDSFATSQNASALGQPADYNVIGNYAGKGSIT